MSALDTTLLKVDQTQSRQVRKKFGLRLVQGKSGVALQNDTDLTLETVFDTEHGSMTFEEFSKSAHQKIRCQAKFRPDSKSMNGYLSKHKDGTSFHFDNGTRIKYVFSPNLMPKNAWSRRQRPLTDTGNAERFVDMADRNCYFIHELSQFIIYQKDQWAVVPEPVIYQATKVVARSILHEASACNDEDQQKALLAWQHRSESRQGRRNMMELAKSEVQIDFSNIDKNSNWVGCNNGDIDLEKQQLLSPDRKRIILNRMNATFDPDAECDRFRSFLDEITCSDPDLVLYLQVLFGMILLGTNPKQIMVMFVGTGSNGKSLLLETMQSVFGDYAVTAEPELFLTSSNSDPSRPRAEIVQLARKRLCITTEPPRGVGLNENLVKRITGNDSMSARVPYAKEAVTFIPNLVPVMSSNHDVRIEGMDHGIWRRIKQIQFNNTFEPDSEKGLPEKLLSERDGILNWLLEGVALFLKDGLIEPKSVVDNNRRYRSSQDVISEWMSECCNIGHGDTKQKYIYQSYSSWCRCNGYRPLVSRELTSELKARGHATDRSRNGRPVVGVTIIPDS